MKKNTRNVINLVFSSFLVTGYIICSYFFSNLAGQAGVPWGEVIKAVILVLFGLLLFYATRVGEGKQVKRFSLVVLLLMVLPSAVIMALCVIPGIPEQGGPIVNIINAIKAQPIVMMLAGVALGYGVPYTFLSGYEMAAEESAPAENGAIAGGLAEELAEAEKDAEGEAEAEAEKDAEGEEADAAAEPEAEKETDAEDKAEEEETEEKAETEEPAEEAEKKAEEAGEETPEAAEATEEAAEEAVEAADEAGEAVEEASEKADDADKSEK